MEPQIQKSFTPQILHKALKFYSIDPSDAHLLDGFESFIFDVQKGGEAFILRIGHDSRRTPTLVQGESEFLNHLAKGGLSVPQVLPSANRRLVEQIPASDGAHFLTTLFEKAPGYPPSSEDWGPPLFRSMGTFMGKLHQLSKGFKPSAPQFSRYDIDQDFEDMYTTGQKHLSPADQPILQAYLETVDEIRLLPKSPNTYGLCHVDFHSGNFFVSDEGKITLFDFDDCQYAWFIYDIAMALFYAIPHDCITPDKLADASRFLTEFWGGYQEEKELNPDWLAAIPLFLRLREIDLYMIIHRSMDIKNLDPWCASFMDKRREKIIAKEPYCAIGFDKIEI
jgi:amicoumacin kinase